MVKPYLRELVRRGGSYQTTIPSDLISRYDIKDGQYLIFKPRKNGILVVPGPTEDQLHKLAQTEFELPRELKDKLERRGKL